MLTVKQILDILGNGEEAYRFLLGRRVAERGSNVAAIAFHRRLELDDDDVIVPFSPGGVGDELMESDVIDVDLLDLFVLRED